MRKGTHEPDEVPVHSRFMECPTVQLLHTLPDGFSHVDWMIATDGTGTSPLVTFRLPGPLATLCESSGVDVIRLPDHRAIYLTYEGELSGGRGWVRRIASGRALWLGHTASQIAINTAWEDGVPRRIRLHLEGESETWRLFSG